MYNKCYKFIKNSVQHPERVGKFMSLFETDTIKRRWWLTTHFIITSHQCLHSTRIRLLQYNQDLTVTVKRIHRPFIDKV